MDAATVFTAAIDTMADTVTGAGIIITGINCSGFLVGSAVYPFTTHVGCVVHRAMATVMAAGGSSAAALAKADDRGD